VLEVGAAFLSTGAVDALAGAVVARLEAYHREQPLRSAMPREELRRRLFARSPEGAFEHVLDRLAAAGTLQVHPDAVALAAHAVRYTPAEEAERARLLASARAAGLEGVEAPPGLPGRVARALQAEGALVRVGEGRLVERDALAALAAALRARFVPGDRIEVAVLKELTGLSRKYVIPLLEYLDRERVTRRVGDARVIL